MSRILFPVTEEEFFRDFWTKQFLHIPGPADKFSDLFPWHVLNRALEQHRFEPNRLRMVKGGQRIERTRYMSGDSVNSARLVNELSAGATLVFSQCEEVHPPLRDLCIFLERLFHISVTANLYAGWRADNGFDVHWDSQDVLILQVSGRKHWKVWKPTRLYPFMSDVVDTSAKTKPADPPLWEGVLEPGAMLNIPRGWWHVATPMNESCLHLTVTALNLNGIDFLRWFKEKMKVSETARMDLPLMAEVPGRLLWLQRLKQDLDALWSDKLFDEFLAEMDREAVPRPGISLPAVADPRKHGLMVDTPLELVAPRPLHFTFDAENASLALNGSEWRINSQAAQRLQKFNDFQPHTLEELTPESDFRVITLVMALIRSGFLREVSPATGL